MPSTAPLARKQRLRQRVVVGAKPTAIAPEGPQARLHTPLEAPPLAPAPEAVAASPAWAWGALWLGAWVGGLVAPPPSAAWPRPLGWLGQSPQLAPVDGALAWMALGLAIAWGAWRPQQATQGLRQLAPWAALAFLAALLFAPYAAWRNPQEGPLDLAGLAPRRWLRAEVVPVAPPRRDAQGGWMVLAQLKACPRFPERQGLLRLRLPPQAARPMEGQRYAVAGALRRPSAFWNPLGPWPGQALARQGAFVQLWAEESRALDPEPGLRWAWGRAVDGWRLRLAQGMGQGLRPDQAGLLAGLCLGDAASEVPDEASHAFRAVGLSHLVAASGAQVGLMAALAWALARLFGFGMGAAAWAAAAGMLAYLALTAGPPSMVRASLMGLLTAVAWARGEGKVPGAALAIAGLGALLWCPAWASDLGYALSVLATWGLLRLAAWGLPKRCPAWLWGAFSVPVVCWAWTLPVQVWAFGQLSGLALLANWLATPVGLLAAPWGLAMGLLGHWAPTWAAACNRPAAWALDAFVAMAQVLAQWPGQQQWLAAWPLGALALALGALLLGLRRWRLALPMLLALGLTVGAHRPGGAGAMAWVVDVGQGLSVVVRSPDGRFALIDGGPPEAGERALLPFLRRLGCRRLDLVVATHAHADHVGGLVPVAQSLPVGQVWEAGQASHEADQGQFLAVLLAQGCPWRTPQAGQAWALGPWVLRSLGAGPGPGTNDGSLATRVEAFGQRILVPGDGEAEAEAHWVGQGLALRAEVLVLGHHGSRTSTSPAFLAAVRPRLAIASAGRHNGFGHPHSSTQAKLARAGVPLARTDEAGAVALLASARGLAWGQASRAWRWQKLAPSR